MSRIEKWLTDEGEPQLRVVSVVGLGGVGKTTLAKELYNKLGKRFECRAFVRSSQKPDVRKLLTSILLQVRPHRTPDVSESSNLASTIKAHLFHQKYFIIIDDLWALSTWDLIHQALPDDCCYSRILTTTEVDAVAHRCCYHNSKHILRMEPLNNDRPQELFSRFYRNQHEFSGRLSQVPRDDTTSFINEISSEIISKCGGFPLAIVSIASLLARQPRDNIERWNYIWSSLNSSLMTNPTMEGMKHVLNLCYNSLPDHLKTCMLYLSLYKEDQIVWKNDLVNQWIAEGFICAKEGEDMEEIGSTYFDELVTNGMIQPVHRSHNGEVLSCTVHYMILQLIQRKSLEENFVIAIHHSDTNIRLADKVRRLSIHFGDAEDAKSAPPVKFNVSQIRSLAFYGHFRSMPSLDEFRLLRVIILDLWGDQDNIKFDISAVWNLTYLEITCNVMLKLQIELQGLQYLETLKINSRISEVPQDIVHLRRLLHLSLPGDTNLPNCIGRLSSLRTLRYFGLSTNSADNVKSLENLMNLRNLHLTGSPMDHDNLEENLGLMFSSVLSKLSNLNSLTLSPAANFCDANSMGVISSRNNISCDLSSPPVLLEKLELSPRICIFSRLPRWIGELGKLSILKIAVSKLLQADINILKKLDVLSALLLYIRTTPQQRIVFEEGFPVLKHFKFICSTICLAFEKGTMPNIRRLKLGFNANRLDQYNPAHACFENLKCLEVFSAKIGCAGAPKTSRQAIKSAIEDAFSSCERRPIIDVHMVDWTFYAEEMSTAVSKTPQAQTQVDVVTKRGRYEQCETEDKDSSDDIISRAAIRVSVSDSPSRMETPEECGRIIDIRPVDTARIINHSSVVQLTMAESVTRQLLIRVKEKASSYLLDKYKVMEGMEVQCKILERKLPAILDIIQDAEEKEASRPGVRAWLKDLKAVAYEASNVFDEFQYEALQRQAKEKGHQNKGAVRFLSPARNPIVFRYRMGKKLRRIVQTIDRLVTEMNEFGFRLQQQPPPSNSRRKTDPIIVDSDMDIIRRSRDQEKKKIMGMLLDEASNTDIMILPIVGMGGLGKTAFVQLIYNDPAIEKHFELRRWCCVSDDFDVSTIASQICQSNYKDGEKALNDLKSMISGKRYLIVLDDVWNRDADMWGKLKTCLKMGGKGSAVLTTTRDAEVARIMKMGVAEGYHIEKLSPKHLKEIVQSRAFRVQKPNSNELDGILDTIVDRCAGSPLAAKAFGSMLSTKTNLNEWKDISAKSNTCNEETGILPILKLSFVDLPSHMKQCFAFCAIFPKDYEIDVEVLIQLWMAHDFIPAQEEDNPEAVGAGIFEELTWRSFFQDVKQSLAIDDNMNTRLSLRKKTICKIHDLMHDIALSVMGQECHTIVEKPRIKKLPYPTRHAFLSNLFSQDGHFETILDYVLNKQSLTLQTLFWTETNCCYQCIDLSKCTSLRALYLRVTPDAPEGQIRFPGQIQHLRYLDLSGNFNLKKLPDHISTMYNLQTLNLSHCWRLCQLPNDMKYMASLRHIYTNGCRSLRCMPSGLGQITSLQTLTYFVIGASPDCSTIGELGNLNLGGELELSGLENVSEVLAKTASLEHKKRITHLSLKWNSKGQQGPEQNCHNKVLYALKPHAGLQKLRIVDYRGTSLPPWIIDLSLLQQLTELHLLGCMFCEEFPQFCHFKALQVLYLERLGRMRSLCTDVASTPFPALKKLQLHDLKRLERWLTTEGKEDELNFPALEEIDIKNCPKLTSLPEAPKLKHISLDEGEALLSLAIIKSRHVCSLSRLKLSIHDTETVPPKIDQNHESSLSELSLKGCNFFFSSCPSEPTFGVWKWFEQLVSLEINRCDVLIYWPEQVFQSLVSLKELSIDSCNKLIGAAQVNGDEPTQTTEQVLPHLTIMSICDCESLVELFILPPSLRDIYIYRCPKFESIWEKKEHLETCMLQEYCHDPASTSTLEQSPSPTVCHPYLEKLSILDCDSLVTIPNLPPSLKTLQLWGCQELQFVSGHLDALEKLDIDRCNRLQSLDSLGDLASLEVLTLSRCQCLASLPGALGSYSALRRLRIKYCPALDLKQFCKCHQQLLDRLEYRDISRAQSSNPDE
ncbi:unnamed protein product, partial [Urochloa humidicola]